MSYVPGSHFVQFVEAVSETAPIWQSMQAAPPMPYLPASQLTHAGCPEVSAPVPAGQSIQAAPPSPYWPGLQSMHSVWTWAEAGPALPAGQSMQAAPPMAYLPGLHGTHASEFVDEAGASVPAGQSMQAAPASPYLPAAHGVQRSFGVALRIHHQGVAIFDKFKVLPAHGVQPDVTLAPSAYPSSQPSHTTVLLVWQAAPVAATPWAQTHCPGRKPPVLRR